MSSALKSLRLQKIVTVTSLLLFILKLAAYFFTHSVAILTDALESTVNVAAAAIGWYSLWVSAKPRDTDHPYGHGKAEFISAGVEGSLITFAGLFIAYEAIDHFIHPRIIKQLDTGLILVGITAVINFILGSICTNTGKKNNSLALIASGKHLTSDAISTAGIMAGLVVLLFTRIIWLDSAIALLFSGIIIYTGYKIIRASVEGIMDKADRALLVNLVALLNQNRLENWIDLHNLRIIKYGSVLHLDCHLTVPWYLNVHEAHREIDQLAALVKKHYGESVELFVHSDGCLDFSCKICNKKDCPERKQAFEKSVNWSMENIISNQKHQLS